MNKIKKLVYGRDDVVAVVDDVEVIFTSVYSSKNGSGGIEYGGPAADGGQRVYKTSRGESV
jgi:hypothetical protein